MQKKKIISQTQIAQEFLGARGQPLNQLCKNSVQLYQEASLQKKKKNTHTQLPLLINYLSLSTKYQRLYDKVLKTTTLVAKKIKPHNTTTASLCSI